MQRCNWTSAITMVQDHCLSLAAFCLYNGPLHCTQQCGSRCILLPAITVHIGQDPLQTIENDIHYRNSQVRICRYKGDMYSRRGHYTVYSI